MALVTTGRDRTTSVEYYIASSTEASDRVGVAERANDQASSVAYALGRLVSVLADEGVLDASDVEYIAGGRKVLALERNGDGRHDES